MGMNVDMMVMVMIMLMVMILSVSTKENKYQYKIIRAPQYHARERYERAAVYHRVSLTKKIIPGKYPWYHTYTRNRRKSRVAVRSKASQPVEVCTRSCTYHESFPGS